MGIFFVKKDLPFSFSLIVWIVFLAVDICGTEYIAQPFLLLILEIATSLFFCILLYYGSIIKKIVCVVIINLLGMISEVVVGLVFIFLDIRYTQYQIAGSLISKLVLLTILRVLKALKHSSLKRKIPAPVQEQEEESPVSREQHCANRARDSSRVIGFLSSPRAT